MRIAKIYVLMCPYSHEIRYVGYTVKTLEERLRAHVHKARSGDQTHRSAWIRSLEPARPLVQLVHTIPESSVDGAERYWITYFREIGCDLTNHSPGGKGTLGIKWSREVIEKRVSKLRGRAVSAETKAKISAANTGMKRSAAARERMSAAKKGKPWSEAQWQSHYSRYGVPETIQSPVYCIECRKGPYRGVRGMYRHYERSHDVKLGLGRY